MKSGARIKIIYAHGLNTYNLCRIMIRIYDIEA
jgi:hypothetical protein